MNEQRFGTRCALCGGEKREGTTTFTTDLGFGVVVVRDVPALVCVQCGADWLSDETAARVEALVNAARDNHAQIEVFAYS